MLLTSSSHDDRTGRGLLDRANELAVVYNAQIIVALKKVRAREEYDVIHDISNNAFNAC